MFNVIRSSGRRSFSNIALPSESCSWLLLEKVADFATERGNIIDYTPWLLTDCMQNTFSLVFGVMPFGGWLGAVGVSALLVRGLVFPFCIQSIREGRLKSTLLPQYSEMLRSMSELPTPSASNSKSAEKLQSLQKKYVAFTAKYGNVAVKGMFASAVQIPMIMTGIVAANGIAGHPDQFPSVALESPLWLTSASLPDPYYILPAINASLVAFNMNYFGSIDSTATPKVHTNGQVSGGDSDSNARIKDLITSRMGSESAERTSAQIDAFYKSKFSQYGKKMFPLLIFGITANFPAITLVYTISNIFGAMIQNYLITSPMFQRVFEIPAQAKKSTDVESSMIRVEEIRKKIAEITQERVSKKHAIEKVAREKFTRKHVQTRVGTRPL